jgi:hypothetical protein
MSRRRAATVGAVVAALSVAVAVGGCNRSRAVSQPTKQSHHVDATQTVESPDPGAIALPDDLTLVATTNGAIPGSPAPGAPVPLSDVTLSSAPYRLVLNLSSEHLAVYEYGKPILDFPAGIGTPQDPTVTGNYFVTMRVPPPDPGYGPFVLVTSAHSDAISDWVIPVTPSLPFTVRLPPTTMDALVRPEPPSLTGAFAYTMSTWLNLAIFVLEHRSTLSPVRHRPSIRVLVSEASASPPVSTGRQRLIVNCPWQQSTGIDAEIGSTPCQTKLSSP